jgi:hypothetical protein
MQSSLGAIIRLDTGLQRRTTTNHTILVLGGTGKAETTRRDHPRRWPERRSLINARVMPLAR